MTTKYTKDKEVRLTILLNKDLKKKYKLFCTENDYVMSERIREFMEKDANTNKK